MRIRIKTLFSQIQYKQKITIIILVFAFLPFIIVGPILLIGQWNTRVNEVLEIYRSNMKISTENVSRIIMSNHQKFPYISSNSNLLTILSTEYNPNNPTTYNLIYSAYQNVREDFSIFKHDGYNSFINIYAFKDSVFEGEYSLNCTSLDKNVIDDLTKLKAGEILHVYRILPDDFGRKTRFYCIYSYVLNIRDKLGIAEIKLPFFNITNGFQFNIPDKSFIEYIGNEGGVQETLNNKNVPLVLKNKIVDRYIKNQKVENYYTIREYFAFDNDNKAYNDQIVMFIPKAYIFREMIGFLIFILFATVIIVGSIFLSVFVTSTLVTKRLKTLLNQTNTNIESLIENNTFSSMQGNDEFSRIDAKFYELINKVNEYYQKISEYGIEKKSFELKLLQERINPHFLYNTLSSIKWAYPDENLKTVIDSMVKYYRTALNKGNEILTVNQEIDMIQAYIELQKFAYRSDLKYEINIDERIGSFKIFKHLLQPIVENAIIHGVNGLEGGGMIRIKGEIEGNYVQFEIEDNGVGMDQEQADKIIRGKYQGLTGGYGMKNLVDRLELYFGEKYYLNIFSEVGVGTKLIIKLPESIIENGLKSS